MKKRNVHERMTKIRLHVSFIIIFSFCMNGLAQGILVGGAVRDAYDNIGLENAQVMILDKDSNIVAVTTTEIPYTKIQSEGSVRSYKNVNSGAIFECTVPKGGNYTVEVRMIGYETKRVPFSVPENRGRKLTIDDIYLLPRPVSIDEVAVTATKLKMYNNGDTLIYNADAFVIDKRNVLEDLVKMLPGVELRDGKVFANGRFVESIIISGKDVMPDNPTQLMKMLPAYIVDKLKFYDKQGEESKTMGKDMLDDSYVMDVYLKRDYHAAWLGNAEIGGGTKKRWEGLGFLMRFDDRQYISVSTDANNLAREREAMDVATVENMYNDRDLSNYQLNLNYSYYPSDKLHFSVGGIARIQDTEIGTEEKQKLLLSSGTETYKLFENTVDGRNDYYKGNASIDFRPVKGLFGKVMYSFEYNKQKDESIGRSMTSSYDIQSSDSLWARTALVEFLDTMGISNVYTDSVHSSSHTYSHKLETEWHFALGGNLLKLKADYTKRCVNGDKRQQYKNSVFGNPITSTSSNNIYDTKEDETASNMRLEYGINYVENSQRRGILKPFYAFSYSKSDDGRDLFVIVPESDGKETEQLDTDNSRRIKEKLNAHTLGLNWNHEMQLKNEGWLFFNGEMSVQMENVDVRLIRETLSDHQNKNYTLFSPSLEMTWNPKAGDKDGSITSLSFNTWCNQTSPNEIYLLNYTDTSDPLNTYMGNPMLEKQTDLGLSLGIRHKFEQTKHTTYAKLNGVKTWNAITMRSVYDNQNGTRTYTPVNVDGKYNLAFECGYSLPLAANQTCWLNLSAGSNFTRYSNMMYDDSEDHSVNFIKLFSYRTKANLRWNDKSRKYEISYTISYNSTIYDAYITDKLHDLSNGLSVRANLPMGFNVSADCNLFTRFGYSTQSLNKTLVLTNAHLSKSFDNDKFEIRLSAIDIFHQRKHVRLTVDGEGQIETVATQYIPAYIMASVRLNWSYAPKKKVL